jgi:hypothetical protein
LFQVGQEAAKANTTIEQALKSPESEHHRFVAPLSSHQPGGADRARRVQCGARVDRRIPYRNGAIFHGHPGTGLDLSSALHGLDHEW